MPIKLKGSSSGDITLDVPATAGTNTLTLPAVTDTLTGIAATQTLTNKTLTSPVISGPSISGDLNYTGTLTGGTGIINIGSSQVYKDASGNVGIGFSSGLGTYGQLEVGGSVNPTMALRSSSGSGTIFAFTSVGATEARINAISNVPMTFFTNNTERMRIDSSGNVGIGTTSPNTKFTVSGTQTIRGVGTDGGIYTCIYMDEGTSPYTSTFAGYTLSLNTGGNSARTSRLYIDNSGNVGIGTTSPGTYGGLVVQAATGIGAPLTLITTDAGANAQVVFKGSRQYQIGTGNASSGFAGSLFVYDGTAGAERMRIDSSGNVGIGGAPDYKLDVFSGSLRINGNARTVAGDSSIYFGSTTNNYIYGGNANNLMAFATNGSERMRIDSIGNVGIGTTSPEAKLDVRGQADFTTVVGSGYGVRVRSPSGSATPAILQFTNNPVTAQWYTVQSPSADVLAFNNGGGTEKMRIDSSGNLLVGKTTTSITNVGWALKPTFSSEYSFDMGGTTNECFNYNNTGTGTYDIAFRYQGVTKGYIRTTSTSVAFTNLSDYRLKEDVQPMTGALAKVALLKPCTYKWKYDGSLAQGFIAHELQEVCPDAVTGEKDAVDADGNPVHQGIDTSFLVATLTAAIQEQQAIIQSLTDRVAQLEAK